MDSSDWSDGIRYHTFDTNPDTEFKMARVLVLRPFRGLAHSRALPKYVFQFYQLNLSIIEVLIGITQVVQAARDKGLKVNN